MKPKRYPYTGRKKGPINLMIDHIQINKALNFIGLDKSHKDFLSADSKEREIQENILEDITSRIEKCEMTLKGYVGKHTKKTGSNIKPEEIPGYQEPVLKFDYRH